jgi:hypothetical protein
MSSFHSKFIILFHGNCIDGWMSCFIAHSSLSRHSSVRQYPIAPGLPSTWDLAAKVMYNTHVLLLDISVPQETRDMWLANGALSVKCIDHHASSIEHWSADACPIHVESCAAIQTWHFFYPTMEMPFWLHHIDRVDRWDHPTEEDRCIREVLNEIAHKPVQRKFAEAFDMTREFIETMSTPEGFTTIIEKGREILRKKDVQLYPILGNGTIINMTPELQTLWNLPPSWATIKLFVIDNTNISFDSTEAAHQVFTYYPQMNVFINYRRKIYLEKSDMAVEKILYIYSARSHGFNLTEGNSIFKGHPTSAGASLTQGEVAILPFIKD